MRRVVVALLVLSVPVGGYFAAQLLQPERFADRTGCLYLSEDSLALRNTCDVPLLARLCTGEDGEKLACRYMDLAPDEKSAPAIDLAAGETRPDNVRYGACKAPHVPSTVNDPNNASLYRFDCRRKGSERQAEISSGSFRWAD